MRALWGGILIISSALSVLADAESDLDRAIAALQREKNYSWTRWVGDQSASTHRPTRGRSITGFADKAERVTYGRTEVGGVTSWHAEIAGDEPSRIVGVTSGHDIVVDFGEGWITRGELAARVARSLGNARLGPHGRAASFDLAAGAHWHAEFGNLIPPTVLDIVRGRLNGVENVAGAVWANLDDEAAGQVLELVKDSNLFSNRRITTRGAYGTAKFWIREGRLSKIEIQVEGRTSTGHRPLIRPPTGWELKQTYTFTFDHFGTSSPDVPDEAREKLGILRTDTGR